MGRSGPLAAVVVALVACGGSGAPPEVDYGPAAYVGAAECGRCHEEETLAWRGSDHDRAMETASEESVLGDFDGATFGYGDVTTTFGRRDGGFFVRTDGPDGALGEYPIEYTFGVRPLQQYLIPFPGGRYQALGVAWDSRPAEEGGRRWFHLYPDEAIEAGDRLHWTADEQTWNYQCADCHSTGLVRGYDAATDTYRTTFEEIDVACEACHGPGSRHVAWASEEEPSGDPQLVVDLRRPQGVWTWEGTANGIARWQGAPHDDGWLGTCAPCHSRRRSIADDPDPTRDWLDLYQPALLSEGLYHADGQILDEVYVWGSFVQSRMHAAGVRCDDCHDPHSTELVADGNSVCASCHLPAVFDSEEHTGHAPKTAGSFCVDCHMPARTYMVVDPRRDHSFRVPRPDLHDATGAPDACTGCHTERDADWAAAWIVERFGPTRRDAEPYGVALAAGRRGAADAERRLVALARDPARPAIARATAQQLLDRYPGPASLAAIGSGLDDPSPLVRAAAARRAAALPPEARATHAAAALSDRSRLVRIAAARAFAGVPEELLAGDRRRAFDGAFAEALAAERATAERPESRINASTLHALAGDVDAAERELRAALELDPDHVAARVNLADLERARGREETARALLEEAVALAPNDPMAVHALGLLEVRADAPQRAIELLARAHELAPDDARFAYVLAVALHSVGRTGEAAAVLEDAHERRPADREVLAALAGYAEQAGETGRALFWARKLALLSPEDPRLAEWIRRLEAGSS